MKYFNILLLTCILFLTSCSGYEPYSPYVYEQNPHYSWGYAQFYGAYYNDYGNKNNVITLSLFSDSLDVIGEGSLAGFGQYLNLEDVFVVANDTLLPVGTYTFDTSGSAYSIAPGINDTIDNEVYTLGATISYYEKNTAKSAKKLITQGTMEVSILNGIHTISCDFKTADNLELKGSFTQLLPHYDESLSSAIVQESSRFKKKFYLRSF